MNRPPDWPKRLESFIAHRESMPFEWGVNDCCTFAAAWIDLLRGTNVLKTLAIGPYSTAGEAVFLLSDRGGVEGVACAFLGEPIHALLAGRGDIVLLNEGGRKSLGVCVGAQIVGPGKNGLERRSILQGVYAWRV